MSYGRNTVTYALSSTWEKYANIDFVDEHSCATSPNASRAIRIFGWTSPAATS
jgi:hypothetical protein